MSVVAPGVWVFHGACRSADNPELFFPRGTDLRALRQAQIAKSFCASCPVRDECLRYALASEQSHGIWGGTTAEERRELARAARGTMQG